jgi:hypothetical protein
MAIASTLRRRLGNSQRGLWLVLAAVAAVGALSGCGAQSNAALGGSGQSHHPGRAGVRRVSRSPVVTPVNQVGASWLPVATVAGQVAVWEAQRSGVTLLRFDQQLVRLALHAGLGEPAGTWRYGDRVGPSEIHHIVAAFNGGFRFETGEVGYMAEGQVAVPLQPGLGSIVTHRDGTTEIGAWGSGVPASGQPVASVLQNLHLLVDHGVAAPTVASCIVSCWGATVGGVDVVARSALGITSSGQLVWAAGEGLLPAGIAGALISAGVQSAVELDINPDWVAGYLFVHGGSGPSAVPVVPGQLGIAGRFLAPYTRDFFTVLAR